MFRWWVLGATLTYLLAVCAFTLGPQPLNADASSALGHALQDGAPRWLTYASLELIANVAMFVPLGIGMMLLCRAERYLVPVGIGLAISASIEIIQHLLPDRVPDIWDVMANTLGAMVGIIVVRAGRLNTSVSRRKARRSFGVA